MKELELKLPQPGRLASQAKAAAFPAQPYTGKRIREFDRAEAELGKTLRRGKRARTSST